MKNKDKRKYVSFEELQKDEYLKEVKVFDRTIEEMCKCINDHLDSMIGKKLETEKIISLLNQGNILILSVLADAYFQDGYDSF